MMGKALDQRAFVCVWQKLRDAVPFLPLGQGCSSGGRNKDSVPNPSRLDFRHSPVPMEMQGMGAMV